MGEAADLILEGVLCQSCGGLIDEQGRGFPTCCEECEVTHHSGSRESHKRPRYDLAANQFTEAAGLATAHGLRLKRCTDTHYQLSPMDGRWLQNIYPGNHRLYFDRNKPAKPPFLTDLPIGWSLIDIVQLTIEEIGA